MHPPHPPQNDIRLCLQNTCKEFVSLTLVPVDIDNTKHADTCGSGSSRREEEDGSQSARDAAENAGASEVFLSPHPHPQLLRDAHSHWNTQSQWDTSKHVEWIDAELSTLLVISSSY